MARPPRPLTLPAAELRSLTTLVRKGSTPARVQTRARILHLLHRQHAPDEIARWLSVGVATVFNVKRRYLCDGLDVALYDRPRSGKPVRIDGVQHAKITALACSAAPEGHARWTLRLLADKAVELGYCETLSHNGVAQVLKKTSSSRISNARGASAR